MTQRGHDWYEVLISSSLSGDISPSERVELDAHLDSCARCTATLAAFAEQRSVMSGLRHVMPPRDLNARVRTGIESGAHAGLPWWRRPTTLFGGLGVGLATVAGALLALTILNAEPSDQNVGFGSGSPMPSAPSATLVASVTPQPSATPSQTAAASPSTTPAATPSPAPQQAAPEPDVYLAYTGPFDNLVLTVRDGSTGETLAELETPGGPPLAAELSPNGQFLAYITRLGESGLTELWVLHLGSEATGGDDENALLTDVPEWTSVRLGQSVAGSEFLEQLNWAFTSHLLAYTLADPAGGGTDVWVWNSNTGTSSQMTSTGNAYAGSWVPGTVDTMALWVSTAADQPTSYIVDFPSAMDSAPISDPAAFASASVAGAFQPLLSPDGAHAIFWRGSMARSGDEWLFSEGGAPFISALEAEGELFGNAQPLFADLTLDQDAFTSAGITWGADSDAYAVWAVDWAGLSQGEGGEYPSARRVYFSHASDPRNIREGHAIDEADLPQDTSVLDVKVTTTRHLLVTVQYPTPGTLSAPRADLIFVGRNTGDVADEVTVLGGGAEGWFGPAAHDEEIENSAP